MTFRRLAYIAVDMRLLLIAISIAINTKLIFTHAFPWWWIGAGLIAWFVVAFIIVACYFDEISRYSEP